MVSEGRARLFRRVDDKYLIYLPKKVVEDSMFPLTLKEESEAYVNVSFEVGGEKKLLIEKWTEDSDKEIEE